MITQSIIIGTYGGEVIEVTATKPENNSSAAAGTTIDVIIIIIVIIIVIMTLPSP